MNKLTDITNNKQGFSLIELMVVIAIIAILASISIPAYKQYTIRAKVGNAMRIIQNLGQQVFLQYARTGSWPSTVPFMGVTLVNRVVSGSCDLLSAAATAATGIGGVQYISSNTKGVTLVAYLDSSVGVPNMVNGCLGTANAINVGIIDAGGSFMYYCGTWGASAGANEVPNMYLPSSCTCSIGNISSYTGGTLPC